MLCLLCVALLSGCGSAANPLPVGTFTNQSDPAQVLELALDPSRTTNIFIRISIETGANKYFGKSVGTYTLKTKLESTKGKFVYMISWARSQRNDSLNKVWFTAENGNTWTLAFQVDGSFVDSSGVAWKRQTRG